MILLALFTSLSFAGPVTYSDRATVEFEQNYLKNPGGENYTAGWTTTGPSPTTDSTASAGSRSISWDATLPGQVLNMPFSSLVQYLGTAAVTLRCRIMAAAGVATHLLEIYDLTTSAAIGSTTITSSTSAFIDVYAQGNWNSSHSIVPRLRSVALNEPKIYTDECKLTRTVSGSGSSDSTKITSIADQSIYRARITFSAGTPSVTEPSGQDVYGSPTDNGIGDTSIAINSGFFNGEPYCWITLLSANNAGDQKSGTIAVSSSSSVRVTTNLEDEGNATGGGGAHINMVDYDFNLFCMGTKP